MADIEILGKPQSNFVWTTRIACAEKGIPHVNRETAAHSPEIDAVHPFGRMPVMRHGDFTLCESRAICRYVDEAFDGPSLIPEGLRQAARTEQWASLVSTTVDPLLMRRYAVSYFFPGTADGGPDRSRIDAALPEMAKQFAILETAVADGFLAAGRFTLADAYLVPILFWLRLLPESGDMLKARPGLSAYVARHLERPSVAGTAPPRPAKD